MTVLPLIGKALMFPLRHWFVTSAGLATADVALNDAKTLKAGAEHASTFAANTANKGLDLALENLDKTIEEGLDNFFGPDNEVGSFLKNHWGKMASSALSLGLLTAESGWAKALGAVTAGLTVLQAYRGITQNEYNISASGQNALAEEPRTLVSLNTLRENQNQLVGTGNKFAQLPFGNTAAGPQPEPQNS